MELKRIILIISILLISAQCFAGGIAPMNIKQPIKHTPKVADTYDHFYAAIVLKSFNTPYGNFRQGTNWFIEGLEQSWELTTLDAQGYIEIIDLLGD